MSPPPAAPGIDLAYTHGDHARRATDPYARAKYALTLRWLKARLNEHATVYNIGCGAGLFNHMLAPSGATIEACEPDPVAYAIARAEAPPNCTVMPGGLQEFAESRGPADLLVMHDVLEHIEDDRGAVDLLRRLIKSGGQAVISVPALMSLFGRHDEALGHYRRYDAGGLRDVLERGFRIRRLRYFAMASIPIVWWFSVKQRSEYPAAGANESLVAKMYGAVCMAETYVVPPIGTSLLALIEPK
ncbi:MAG: class I SAM-dependent methyltransferase [Candidatus Eremiobacteraeota bacterium]|nr:class I SAM-dependent methyltransferase [Candidatus Eremiobacteraeota bacterium]